MSSLETMLQAPGAMRRVRRRSRGGLRASVREGLERRPAGHSADAASASSACSRYCDRDFDQPVVKIPPRYGAATPIRLAANAVMAGCRPEYFPLVLLALEALAEEPYNLYGTQATTHPCTPMLIFNGPVAKEVGMNAGHNVMGNYFRANAAIGRAVRLALVNIGAAIPGHRRHGDRRHAGQVHLLRGGERGREPVGAAARRARLPRGREHRDGRSRRRARTTSTTTRASPPKAYSR